MKDVVVVGKNGTLGCDLMYNLRDVTRNLMGISRDDMDLSNFDETYLKLKTIHDKSKIDYIVNCSAYTNTYIIETSLEHRNRSYLSNSIIPWNLAVICRDLGIKLIHISTDYVFSENSQLVSQHGEFPTTIYGLHKLIGDLNIQNTMEPGQYIINRVGWIYGYRTQRSFIHKFIKNMASKLKDGITDIEMVDDQISTPTSTQYISNGIINQIVLDTEKRSPVTSISPIGSVSKFNYAMFILQYLKDRGIDRFKDVNLVPVKTDRNVIGYPEFSSLNALSHSREEFVGSQCDWQVDFVMATDGHLDSLKSFIEEQFQ